MIWCIIIAILIGIGWTFGVLMLSVQLDFAAIKKYGKVNHNNRFWKRCGALIPAILALAYPVGWWGLAISPFLIGGWYWTFFDGLLSKRRGFNFWYIGSPGDEDGRLEAILQKKGEFLSKVYKISAIIVFTGTYIAAVLKVNL